MFLILFRPEFLKNPATICFLPDYFFAEKITFFFRQKQMAVEYSSTEFRQEMQLILPMV